MLTKLKGQIEKVTYANEQSGFAVVQVTLADRPETVTVVGHLMSPTPGETIEMKGEWVHHAKFGHQFKLLEHHTVVPTGTAGIQKYLGSGMIPGLGPKMAARIVKKFGEQSLEIMANDVDQLAAIEGIGPKRLQMIKKAWRAQRKIRDVMLFLQSHDIGLNRAIKIFRHYGDRSIALVKSNPYRLASDIAGIGFNTADRIAARMGFTPDSPERVAAGLLYILSKLAEEGHVFYPFEKLLVKGEQALKVAAATLTQALRDLADAGKIVIDRQNDLRPVYLTTLFRCETHIAKRIADLLIAQPQRPMPDVNAPVAWVQQRLSIKLAPRQIQAVKTALDSKVMIVTGGPGTGKTTLISALLKIYHRLGMNILLAAPTGRAAKRMFAATGYHAVTIHRLLEYSFQKGGFQRKATRPLACNLLIVDEVSMIDTVLMYHLLQAVPNEAALVLVGDVDQLPSVGPGRTLSDLLASKGIPSVRLTQIFRQARASRIITNAHRINHGRMPAFEGTDRKQFHDFFFIEQKDPQKVLAIIVKLVSERIPQRFGFDAFGEIQVLTPMRKGLVGADNLNAELQQHLNPDGKTVSRGGRVYRVGDKIMQVRNNYDKEVFNGDVGFITQIRRRAQELTARFDDRLISYRFTELDEIVLAYAMSVHKSQGSEYAAVVLPVLTQHYILLQRNLLYTAITRGRQLVVLVGSRKALAMGVKNNQTQERYTLLSQRLNGALEPSRRTMESEFS